ncbi:MAG: hypothetical protein AAB401_07215, partial [Acidobacteriota bacterium]
EFREILIAEIRAATGFRTLGAGIDDCANRSNLVGAVPVALYGQAEIVSAALPPKMACLLIRTRSVTETLKGETAPSIEELITVVSSWPTFLNYGRSMLAAVKVDQDSLDFRDARIKGWQKGLRSSSFVITDAATAALVPPGIRTRIFQIISDSSLVELRSYVEKFLTGAKPEF